MTRRCRRHRPRPRDCFLCGAEGHDMGDCPLRFLFEL